MGAPLSRRKALLAVMLADACADRLFAADPAADDILVFRDGLRRRHPSLGLIFDIAAGRSPIVIEAVEVPIARYGELRVEDFMVSLYNGHTVQRLRIALPDGGRLDIHAVLAEAMAALRGAMAP